jgi:hypothetical protein
MGLWRRRLEPGFRGSSPGPQGFTFQSQCLSGIFTPKSGKNSPLPETGEFYNSRISDFLPNTYRTNRAGTIIAVPFFEGDPSVVFRKTISDSEGIPEI